SAALDDVEAIKGITDSSFVSGKIGFWTKSDSKCSFAETRISYQPKEILARTIVRQLVERFSRVKDLKLFLPDEQDVPRVLAAKDSSDLGTAGGKAHKEVINRNTVFVAKMKRAVNVILPLHDRNGEAIGAVEVSLETFPGQTEDNAVTRARPFVN